uniref:Putative methyltransferase n=3 Tax=viral metagenome TaxID=1070528 RepID=A0A6M3JIJ1_9ZZZZ
MNNTNNTEVFGNTFKHYNKEDMEGFVYPFKVRFALNGIDYKEVFRDKYCLDAGCGSGRGSLFMAEGGAKHITSFDISEENIKTTRKNFHLFGCDGWCTHKGSLLDIPYENNTFDVVWCNGVAHHTGDTGGAIKELIRVLKPDGHLWLYVYGGGGIFWSMVHELRKWVEGIEPDYAIKILRDNKFTIPEVGEIVDHLFCKYLYTYSYFDIWRFLTNNGMVDCGCQLLGMPYDTNMRKYLFGAKWVEENRLMGEGDLRFWCRKKSKSISLGSELEGMNMPDLLPAFKPSHKNWDKIIYGGRIIRYGGRIIRHLKREMNKLLPFDIEKFTDYLRGLNLKLEI